MKISASVQSKAYKAAFLKHLFPKEKGRVGLRTFVGRLDLSGVSKADFALLGAMYRHVFSLSGDAQGHIAVFDKDGKEVMRYSSDGFEQ